MDVLGEREWLVARTDDAGNSFLVSHGLGEHEAALEVEAMDARGHKQAAWSCAYPPGGLEAEILRLHLLR